MTAEDWKCRVEKLNYENHDLYMSLCVAMGRPFGIPYGLLLDALLTSLTHRISLDPAKVERYIFATRGKSVSDGESIRDLVVRIYGENAANLMEKLF